MVLEAVNAALDALFFGSGSLLGLILMLGLCFSLQMGLKYLGALIVPIMILFGLEYIDNGLGWHALLMFFGSIIVLLIMAKQFQGGIKK